MYSASLESVAASYTFELTGHETSHQVVSITGLAPVPAQINTNTAAGLDGAYFNSSRLTSRNIVITLKLNDPETVRRTLEQYFPTKAAVRFHYSAGGRTVYIDGYVETFECDLFSNNETAQISILCPQPMFKSSTLQSIILNADHHTRSFESVSANPTGIFIVASVAAAGGISGISFENTVTGDTLTINYAFRQMDRIQINTQQGEKEVVVLREVSGLHMEINLVSKIVDGSKFPQASAGAATFTYRVNGAADELNKASVVMYYNETFPGV